MSPIYFLVLSWVIAYQTAPLAEGTAAHKATPLEFQGEMVDGDLPATYRLPPVTPLTAAAAGASADSYPLFFPPLSPDQAQWVQQWTTTHPPAGSPPDDLEEPQESLNEQRQTLFAVQSASAAAAPVLPPTTRPFTPITADLDAQLLPAVQRGYTLGQRGALFAARTEFVEVLRRVAQAKDIAAGSDEHSQALAAGLRALDEAEDFILEGLELEAELDVRKMASSHRSAVLPEPPAQVLPHDAVALYHEFAREQLARSVQGEQAGSMALYGLGRIDAQLAQRKDDDLRYVRGAMTMYAAALAACPNNHLAANELGVLECRTGRPAEAARLFQRAIDFAPTATAYHNLAVAQQKLGFHLEAHANEQESQRLAGLERAKGALSQRAGVQWVAPQEMARVPQPASLTASPTQAAAAALQSPPPWQRTVEMARSLTGSSAPGQSQWR